MSKVKWIKITTDMFADEKIQLIEDMPEADTILVIWIKLLTQAGKTNASGYIYLNETIPYNEDMLATIFRRPVQKVRLALNVLQQFGMIELTDNNWISITNWEEHQNIEGMEKIKEQTRQRVAKHRVRKKVEQIGNAYSNVTVTKGNALDIEEEKEKHIVQSENGANEEFETFWNEYPRKEGKPSAKKSFDKAIQKHSFDIILTGIKNYKAECTKENREKKHIKMAQGWLNDERYLDFQHQEKEKKPIQKMQKIGETIVEGDDRWQPNMNDNTTSKRNGSGLL